MLLRVFYLNKMSIEEIYSLYKEYPFVCTDTRNITNNSIFFALKGGNFNGNKFAEQALSQGCAYAIIDEAEYSHIPKTILVKDVLTTLQELSAFHRRTFKIPVIGITGSNGKTTTKELINAILSTQYNTFATRGNLNNHIGVPLSLLEVNPKHEIAIIEMGANHVGEIQFLSGLSTPDYGLITNIGKAHLEGFGSYENVIIAKTELYQNILKRGGKIFINNDNNILTSNSGELEKITYGQKESNFVSASLNENSESLSLRYKNLEIKTQLVGSYNFENALSAIAIGKYFGISDSNIKKALEEYSPTNNRSQLIKKESNTIIMDAYNANPVSMQAALRNLNSLSAKKVAILGDMKELGEYSYKEHKDIVDLLIKHEIEAYLVGKEFSNLEQERFETFENVDDLCEHLKSFPIQNATILVKGSRGIKLESVVNVIE